MTVTQFRARRPGPELDVEDAVIHRATELFPHLGPNCCALGSVPVGAGIPDLIYLGCDPVVSELVKVEFAALHLLAYLHLVTRARPETITSRLGRTSREVSNWLDQLLEAGAVVRLRKAYEIDPKWRGILPQVIAIEAKVSDWRRAFDQAARNRIFARESYVAVPMNLAVRLKRKPEFIRSGIGILGVRKQEVTIQKRARTSSPRIWEYYYRLAFLAAEYMEGNGDSIRC